MRHDAQRAVWWITVGLTVLAATLRFWEASWGMPERIGLHPDEAQHVMSHALAISLADPDPHFLNYPSFLIYLIALVNGGLSRLGVVTEPWQSYLIARSIVASFGTLTAPAVFWLGLELGSPLAAGLGGLWVALLPLHVWESHFAVTDVMMTFWIVVTLAGSLRILRRGQLADYLLVGMAFGLAVASKYTAAFVVVSPLIAVLLAHRPVAPSLRNLVALAATALAFSFVATPFSFLHFSQLRAAMAFENQHVHSLHYGFSLPAPGWQYHKYVYELFAAFPFSLGFALWAAAAAGTAWAVLTLRRETAIVLGFAVPFFAVLGHWTFKPLRYMLPVEILGAMFAGLWLGSWIESGHGWRRTLGASIAAVVLLYTALFTISTTSRLGHDTRIEAAHWLDSVLRPGERLLLCGYSPYLAVPTDPRIGVDTVGEVAISRLAERSDDSLVEISSLHFWRHERHHHPAFEPAYYRFRSGENGFRLVKRFEGDFLNREIYRQLDPMFAGYFISPTLEFYAREPSTVTEQPRLRAP
jgi:hypothetical protein